MALEGLPNENKTTFGFTGGSELSETTSAQDKKILDYAWELFEQSGTDRHRFARAWPENERMFRGEHWPDDRPLWKASPVTNLCSTAILPMVSLLTDNRPIPEVISVDPNNYHVAAALDACIKYAFYDNDFQALLPDVLQTAAITGTGFLEPDWDPQKLRIILRERDCYDVFVLGGPDIEDCDSVIVRSWLPLYEIRRLWPEHADKVKPEEPHAMKWLRPRWDVKTNALLRHAHSTYDTSGGNARTYYTGTGNSQKRNEDSARFVKGAWVIQVYIKDPMESESGRRAYPTWRHITGTKDVKLADRAIELEHGKVPLIKVTNWSWSSEFWGRSELHDVKGVNLIHNMTLGIILDLMRLGANPPLLVPALAGLDIRNFIVKPGAVQEYHSREGEPHWMQPVPISQTMFNVLGMMENFVRTLTGSGEISEGTLPFKGASGVLVSQLRELAQTRVRAKSRNLEISVKKLGFQVMRMVQQYWNFEDVVMLVGPVPPEKLAMLDQRGVVYDPNQLARFIQINKVIDFDGVTGQPIKLNDVSMGKHFVQVRGTSGLPISRRGRLVEAIELLKNGVVDIEYVWDTLDIAEAAKVRMKTRMEEAKAAAMAAQQGQAPPGAPPGPPPGGGGPQLPMGGQIGTSAPAILPPGMQLPGPESIGSGQAPSIPI